MELVLGVLVPALTVPVPVDLLAEPEEPDVLPRICDALNGSVA